MGEFDAGNAAANIACVSFLIVLRSIPVLRPILCCETLFYNDVITVVLFCGVKTFTPDPLVKSRGDHVLSSPLRIPLVSTSAYRLLGDFEVAITGGVWVATGGFIKRCAKHGSADPLKSQRNEYSCTPFFTADRVL